MRVLYVTYNGKLEGGANIALKNLIDDLSKRDISIHVALGQGDFPIWLKNHNIPYTIIPHCRFFQRPQLSKFSDFLIYPLRLGKLLFHHYLACKVLINVCKDFKPDFIQTNNSPTLYGYFTARILKIPHIWSLREYLGLNVNIEVFPNNKWLINNYLSKSFTVSITKDVAEYFKCNNPHKDFVINDGVMHETDMLYDPYKLPYFLYVGNVHRLKGCNDLIHAFCKFANEVRNINLLIVGQYKKDYKAELDNIIKQSGHTGRVEFLGFREDRYKLMSKALALIMPSPIEGFGFVTIEAIMNGCLVIGRNTTGTKLIIDDMDGKEMSFDDVPNLINKMKEVVSLDSTSLENRIKYCQEIAKEKYSIEKYGNKYFKLYKYLK